MDFSEESRRRARASFDKYGGNVARQIADILREFRGNEAEEPGLDVGPKDNPQQPDNLQ